VPRAHHVVDAVPSQRVRLCPWNVPGVVASSRVSLTTLAISPSPFTSSTLCAQFFSHTHIELRTSLDRVVLHPLDRARYSIYIFHVLECA
jgi:hypothetical protein